MLLIAMQLIMEFYIFEVPLRNGTVSNMEKKGCPVKLRHQLDTSYPNLLTTCAPLSYSIVYTASKLFTYFAKTLDECFFFCPKNLQIL